MMGCDIHLFSEIYSERTKEWVTFDFYQRNPYFDEDPDEIKWVPCEIDDERWYDKFGVLAEGVRGQMPYSFPLKGIPHDSCPEIQKNHKSWAEDAHSANHITIKEFRDMHIKYRLIEGGSPLAEMHKATEEHIKRRLRWDHIIDSQNWDHVRFVYWFDN